MSTTTNKRTVSNCCGGCFAVFLILALCIAIRWSMGVSTLNLVVPLKTNVPSPNALDTYQSAAQLLFNTSQVDDAIASKPKLSRTLAQKEALLKLNAGALNMLRSGFTQEYMDASPRSVTALYPYFAQERKLARLLQLESMVLAEKGDWKGAVNSGLDAMQLGEDIPHSAPLIGRLVGVACEAIGRRSLWDYIDHLDAAQSRAAIKRLEAVRGHHTDYAETLREEKYISSSALNMVFKDSGGLQSFSGTNVKVPAALYNLMYIRWSKDSIARGNQHYFDVQIANAGKPYASHLPPPQIPADPINQVLVFDWGESREKDVAAETHNALLASAIALHAYRLEHGRYPQTLNELAPTYLTSVPDDEFALKGPLHYKISDSKYVLYSVGPDGMDDGGRPIDDPSKATPSNKKLRYSIFDDSKGDIVAGVNKW